MKPRIWIAIVLVAGVGVFLLLQTPSASLSDPDQNTLEISTPSSSDSVLQPGKEEGDMVTNYDECIAGGNLPLQDAPDKCLTKDGHVFIQGVVE